MKKFLAAVLIGAALAVCGHFNAAYAQDIWYDADDMNQWYVRSESIKQSGNTINCDSIIIYSNGKHYIAHEQFQYAGGIWNFRFPKTGTLRPVDSDEHFGKMFGVVRNYLGI